MPGEVWVSESAPELETGLPMVEAIAKLRDEITSVLMQRHRGSNRELALVLTKLDEARLWGIAYDEKTVRRVVVDRTKVLRSMAEERARESDTDTQVTTVPTGAGRGLADV